MRVLIDIRHLGATQRTGIGRYTLECLRALFEISCSHQFILFSSGRIKPSLQEMGLVYPHVTHVHVAFPNRLLTLQTLLLQHPPLTWYTKESIDLLFLPTLNFATLPSSIPTLIFLHDMSWYLYPHFYSFKMRLWHHLIRPLTLIRRATHILTPSISTARDLIHIFNTDIPHTVIPHGIQPWFSPNFEARDHGVRSRLKLPKHYVLFVGTIEPRKNVLALIEAVKKYRELHHDDLHLVLVGSWGWKSHRVRHRLFKKDVSVFVHHLGFIDDRDLPCVYRSAKVFVWPSIYEGFGLPVLEAMACGTPVVTSHTSSLPEVTQGNAVLIDPYNIHDITEAIHGILQSDTFSKSLRSRALIRAKSYNWNACARTLLQTMEQIIATSKK